MMTLGIGKKGKVIEGTSYFYYKLLKILPEAHLGGVALEVHIIC